jgi:hypothetical protein
MAKRRSPSQHQAAYAMSLMRKKAEAPTMNIRNANYLEDAGSGRLSRESSGLVWRAVTRKRHLTSGIRGERSESAACRG